MAKTDPVAMEAAERARAFTQAATVFDCLGLFYVLDEPYATRCLEAGVNICNVTFALESTWDQTMSAVDEGFAKIEASPVLALARNTAEIEAALAAGRLAVIPGTQGSSMIGKELARVGILARLGFRFFGLAYTGATLFADGCGEKRDAGLSFLGEELIAAVNETAMILDLSHTGHRSRAEAVPLARAPVCTHSNAWHHVPNDRNTKDETVRAICAKGGMMGACCLPLSVSPVDQTLDHLIDHVDHFKALVGAEHIGIGLDFTEAYQGGQDRTAGIDPLAHAPARHLRPCRGLRNPALSGGPRRYSRAAQSRWAALRAGLRRRRGCRNPRRELAPHLYPLRRLSPYLNRERPQPSPGGRSP